MKSRLNGFLTVAAAGILALALVPQANATVELRLTNGVTVVTVLDGSGLDNNATTGVVGYSGVVGNRSVVASTGISNNAPPFLDLGSSTFTGTANPGLLTMEASADGYNPAANGFSFNVGGTTRAGAAYAFSAYLDNNNALFGTGLQLGPTLNLSGANFSSGASGSILPTQSPYSLTVKAVLSGVTGITNSLSSYNADLSMSAVPEPAVVTLLGGALLLSMGAIRRKARRS